MYGQNVDKLSTGEIIGLILGIVIALVIQFFVAKKFEKVAIMKGHPNAHAFAWCFWLGIVGCIYVAALPDVSIPTPTLKHMQKNTDSPLRAYECNSIVKTERVTSAKCFACHEFYPEISFCKITKDNGTVEFPVCDKCIEQYEEKAKNS